VRKSLSHDQAEHDKTEVVVSCLLISLLVLGTSVPLPVSAHTRSESHSAWTIKGRTVHLQFTVPDLESKRITPDGEMPSVEQLGAH
jgi:hypothetical protein